MNTQQTVMFFLTGLNVVVQASAKISPTVKSTFNEIVQEAIVIEGSGVLDNPDLVTIEAAVGQSVSLLTADAGVDPDLVKKISNFQVIVQDALAAEKANPQGNAQIAPVDPVPGN